MGTHTADYLLTAAGLLGHCLVLLLLVRRRWLRRLPAFALLIAFYLLRSALLLIPRFSTDQQEMYWLLIYLDPVLQLLVLLGGAALAWRRRKAIAFAIPFMLLLAAVFCWLVGSSSHYSPQNLAIKLGIFVSALWLQAAVALFLVLRKADPPTTRLPLGIAFGFAAYSVINIVTEAVHLHSAALSYLRVAVYLGCLATWSFLLWKSPHTWRETAYQRETAGR